MVCQFPARVTWTLILRKRDRMSSLSAAFSFSSRGRQPANTDQFSVGPAAIGLQIVLRDQHLPGIVRNHVSAKFDSNHVPVILQNQPKRIRTVTSVAKRLDVVGPANDRPVVQFLKLSRDNSCCDSEIRVSPLAISTLDSIFLVLDSPSSLFDVTDWLSSSLSASLSLSTCEKDQKETRRNLHHYS